MEEPQAEQCQGSGDHAPAPTAAAAAGEEAKDTNVTTIGACGDAAGAAAGDGTAQAGPAAGSKGGRPKDRAKRSVALHTGYVGTGFKGSSINRTLGDDVTIEQVLEKALFAAGCISEANFGSFAKIRWSRASRTDKGVHSLGTVMGLRMLVDDARYVTGPGGDCEGLGLAASVNTHLPPQIRVFTVQKTNKKFSARHMCETRVYQYYLPASMIELKCDGSEEDAQRLAAFRDTLKCYEGAHPFHNFTRRVTYQPGGSNNQYRPGRGKRGWGEGNDDTAAAGAGAEGAVKQEPQSAAADADAGAAPAAKDGEQAAGAAADGAAAADEQVAEAEGSEPAAKRLKPDPEAAEAAGAAGAGGRGGRGRGGRGGRGAGGRGSGGGRKRRGSEDGSEDEEEEDEEGGGELDDDDDEVAAAAAAATAAQEGQAGEPNAGDGADGDGKGRFGPYGRVVLLRWQTEMDPRDRITQTYYRRIHYFTAADPKPMVEGGEPCLLLEVSGQSFMLHHIRHMIGAAVAVTLGLMSKELLLGSMTPPARVTLPRAPPHTLLLSDCSFGRFPSQQGPGDNDLCNVTGERLSMREGGRERKEAFRNEVLLPALQQLVALPEWQQWKASLHQVYPFPEAAVEEFVTGYRRFAERKEQQRKEREEEWQKRREAGEDVEGDGEGDEEGSEEGGEGRRRHGGGRGGRGGRGGGGGGGGWRGGRGRGGGRGWGGRRGGRGAW
ncbi:hypothetical protein HXX76_004286 [Chlamydomonas incerta]|uniref:Pseudouridine synthase I TruA alpha/beta domain-containing protein n=1 Tax=Chlamydomonas incerta TaxID=51695 RepID=A0A835W7G0_CHLIN|nr:hypothetical protein HXX76_004286 [Chlamydomonas incerta]|eukprot:KAG2440173.1 hypothetical protein HXX76_004286 [Chlamydomonas incerta]